jgi:hypothetical protein
MKTYEASLTAAEGREEEFEAILVDALDPYNVATENFGKDLPSPASVIFSTNCLLAVRSTLAPFTFTRGRVAKIDATVRENSTSLIEDQYTFFLQNSGLLPLLQALKSISGEPTDPSQVPSFEAFQPQALINVSQILDDFLPSALMDAMENLNQLHSTKLAREITEKAAERFCEDFETVEEAILSADDFLEESANSDKNEVENPEGLRALFPRTSGEIRVLLS